MKISQILLKIIGFIKELFLKMPTDVKNAIEIGVEITQFIKKMVDSPFADVLTALIPGTIDDKLKDYLSIELPEILIKLTLANSDEDNPIQTAVFNLKTMDNTVKNSFLHSISIMGAQAASSGKLSWGDGVYLLEWYYKNKYKKDLR